MSFVILVVFVLGIVFKGGRSLGLLRLDCLKECFNSCSMLFRLIGLV